MIPTKVPIATAQIGVTGRSRYPSVKYPLTKNNPAPMNVVLRKAAAASMFFITAIENTPMIEEMYPTIANTIGNIR